MRFKTGDRVVIKSVQGHPSFLHRLGRTGVITSGVITSDGDGDNYVKVRWDYRKSIDPFVNVEILRLQSDTTEEMDAAFFYWFV